MILFTFFAQNLTYSIRVDIFSNLDHCAVKVKCNAHIRSKNDLTSDTRLTRIVQFEIVQNVIC